MGKDHELLEAARTGNQAVVEKLLSTKSKSVALAASLGIRFGVNVNCQDQNGYTPLHHAALNGHSSVVMLLLQAHALVHIADVKGSCPLHLAAWNGHKNIVHVLLTNGPSFANVNEQNGDKETALHCAALHGHNDSVRILLENHADPTIRNTRDETALDLASQYGRLDVVRLLLNFQPKLLAHSSERFTPLHLASRNGHRAVVELLLAHGADINKVGANGTALHEAALFGKYDVVRLLLKRGSETGTKDASGRTALELVSQLDTQISRDIAKLIIERIQDEDDYEPLSAVETTTERSKKKGVKVPLMPKIPLKNLDKSDGEIEAAAPFDTPTNVFSSSPKVSRNLSRSFGEADLVPREPSRGRPSMPGFRYSHSSPMTPRASRSPGSHRIRSGLLRRTSSARSARSLPRLASTASYHGNRSVASIFSHGKKSESNAQHDLSIHQHHPSIDMFPVTPTPAGGRKGSVSLPSSPQLKSSPVRAPSMVAHGTPVHAEDDVFFPRTPTSGRQSFETFLPHQPSVKSEPKMVIPLKPPAPVGTQHKDSKSHEPTIFVTHPSMSTTDTQPTHGKLSVFVSTGEPPPLPKKSTSSPPSRDESVSPPLPAKLTSHPLMGINAIKNDNGMPKVALATRRASQPENTSRVWRPREERMTLPRESRGSKEERSLATRESNASSSSSTLTPSISSVSELSPGLRSPNAPAKPQRQKLTPPPLPPKPAHMANEPKKPRPPSPTLPPPPDEEISDADSVASEDDSHKRFEENPSIGVEEDVGRRLSRANLVDDDDEQKTPTVLIPSDDYSAAEPSPNSTALKPVPVTDLHKAPDIVTVKKIPPGTVTSCDLPPQNATSNSYTAPPGDEHCTVSSTAPPCQPDLDEATYENTITGSSLLPPVDNNPAQNAPPSGSSTNDPMHCETLNDASAQLSPTLSPSPPFSPPSPNTAMLEVSSALQKTKPPERTPTFRPIIPLKSSIKNNSAKTKTAPKIKITEDTPLKETGKPQATKGPPKFEYSNKPNTGDTVQPPAQRGHVLELNVTQKELAGQNGSNSSQVGLAKMLVKDGTAQPSKRKDGDSTGLYMNVNVTGPQIREGQQQTTMSHRSKISTSETTHMAKPAESKPTQHTQNIIQKTAVHRVRSKTSGGSFKASVKPASELMQKPAVGIVDGLAPKQAEGSFGAKTPSFPIQQQEMPTAAKTMVKRPTGFESKMVKIPELTGPLHVVQSESTRKTPAVNTEKQPPVLAKNTTSKPAVGQIATNRALADGSHGSPAQRGQDFQPKSSHASKAGDQIKVKTHTVPAAPKDYIAPVAAPVPKPRPLSLKLKRQSGFQSQNAKVAQVGTVTHTGPVAGNQAPMKPGQHNPPSPKSKENKAVINLDQAQLASTPGPQVLQTAGQVSAAKNTGQTANTQPQSKFGQNFQSPSKVTVGHAKLKAHNSLPPDTRPTEARKTEHSSQLRPQSDLHFSATEVKRARICSTKSLTEQCMTTPPVYSDYDNVPHMLPYPAQHEDERVLKTKRSASLGPQMGVSPAPKPLSLPRPKQRSQTIAAHRMVCDAFTQTFPPKVIARRKLSQTRKSRSLDVYYETRNEASLEDGSNAGGPATIYASNSLSAVHNMNAKRRNFVQQLNRSESSIPTSKPNAKKPQPPVKPALLKNFKSLTKTKDFKTHPQDGRSKQNKMLNSGLKASASLRSFDSTSSVHEPQGIGEVSAISVLSLDTSDDWNDALSDRTEDLAFPKEVQKYRGLIRGSSISYRSRLTSCREKDAAYESDEFEYDYKQDRKEAYSRVNASLQPDDEFEDVRYSTVVTSESSNNKGGFHQTRLGEAENDRNQINLMDENRGDLVVRKPLKPVKHLAGEPGEKRRREEQTNFARLVLLHNNQTKNPATSQGGIINYALTTPTHSRASSYDNNNNNNSTDGAEDKIETAGEQHRSARTSSHPLTKSNNATSAPPIPSPMSDGMPDFGAIVDTVTAVRSKTSPHGSTSGVSSSSSSKSSTLAKQPETQPADGGFNENDEWAQIANVMKSVGSSLNKDKVYAQEFEETFWRIMTGSDLPRYVGTWLSDLNLSQYEEVLCGNGFDNINFLASDILEEQDLIDMNILNTTHQRRMLDSAKNLPKIRTLASFTTNDNAADARTAPTSVSEWLQSLALCELEQTFKMMGIMTLERVKSMKDTEIAALVNLRGHRKRIRASIGHRNSHPNKTARSMSQPARSTGAKQKSSPPLPRSPLLDKVNFFKDYSKTATHSKTNSSLPSSNSYGTTSSSSSAFTNYSSLSDQVVPVAISEEPSIESSERRSKKGSSSTTRYHRNLSSPAAESQFHRQVEQNQETNNKNIKDTDFSQVNFGFQPQEEDLLTLAISKLTETSKKTNGKHENKENIGMTTASESEIRVPDARRASYLSSTGGELVLRPPNETTEEVSVSSWCHNPEVLIKSCCNYQAYYLGSMLVHEVKGVESTVEACSKMKRSTDSMKKIPTVTLSISYRGVKFIDSKSKHEIAEHEIHNISFASQDADDLSTLAYITRDARTGNHYCHVFRVTTLDVAYEIILTLGQAFEVAYQLILKERSLQDGTA